MTILKNSYLVIAAVLSVLSIRADFTEVNVWQREAGSGEKQLLVTCGDDHSVKTIGLKQAQDVVAMLAANKNNSIIIEDALDYSKSIQQLAALQDGTENHQHLMDDFQNFQTETLNSNRRQDVIDRVMSGIVLVPELATEQGISCDSIEFRQLITFQLPDLLELIDEYGYDHRAVVKKMLDAIYTKIASFNDSPELNDYYKEILDKFAPIKHMLDLFVMNTQEPMVNFPAYVCESVLNDPVSFNLECLTYASPHPFLVADKEKTKAFQRTLFEDKNAVDQQRLQKRIEIDFVYYAFSPLIDAYIMHALYTKQLAVQHGNTTALCAGLAHTMSIEQFLPQLGYQQIATFQNIEGVAIADALQNILNPAHEQGSNQFRDVVVAMADGVKSAFDAVTSFFGLA